MKLIFIVCVGVFVCEVGLADHVLKNAPGTYFSCLISWSGQSSHGSYWTKQRSINDSSQLLVKGKIPQGEDLVYMAGAQRTKEGIVTDVSIVDSVRKRFSTNHTTVTNDLKDIGPDKPLPRGAAVVYGSGIDASLPAASTVLELTENQGKGPKENALVECFVEFVSD